ncbi:hypothetical protein ACFY2T_25620 [Streptomyces sp. NPDC001260]|uniref:hypothetical protein n=1 Tax=Streptomyces sp. NPDC001260 TaxID=3364551 RepID=UPI0036A87D74
MPYRPYSVTARSSSATARSGCSSAIVQLDSGSTWTVTGTSHLTSLTLAADAAVRAPRGRRVTLTVDGKETALTPGAG